MEQISPSELHCPWMSIPAGPPEGWTAAPRQNDWKAVEELTARLGQLDPQDPVKYDLPSSVPEFMQWKAIHKIVDL